MAPFFPDRPGKQHIGEVWFTFEENSTSLGKNLGELLREQPQLLGAGADPAHPGLCPILVKLLFTTERLSVQVHPDDTYAQLHHGCLGKTEAWYVLDSHDPGEVAVGFKEQLEPGRLEAVAKSGEIQHLLDWRKVKKGDVIFTPAGTVHAIGAGVTICEIQQNSDITYRLYDYGRPRELHLEHGAHVSKLSPHTETPAPLPLAPGRDELSACPYFRIERLRPLHGFGIRSGLPTYALAICTDGVGTFDGKSVRAGQGWFIPADSDAVEIDAPNSEWILTYSSPSALDGINLS